MLGTTKAGYAFAVDRTSGKAPRLATRSSASACRVFLKAIETSRNVLQFVIETKLRFGNSRKLAKDPPKIRGFLI